MTAPLAVLVLSSITFANEFGEDDGPSRVRVVIEGQFQDTTFDPSEQSVNVEAVPSSNEAAIRTRDAEAEAQQLREQVEKLEHRLSELESQATVQKAKDDQGLELRVGYGQDVLVKENEVVRQAISYGGDVTVEGTVLDDAMSYGGDVYVSEGGAVLGNAVSVGGAVDAHSGAVLKGDSVSVASLYNRLIFALAFAGMGVLAIAVAPHRITRIARSVKEHPFKNALIGMAVASVLIVGIALFAVTIIGIPVSLLLTALLGLMWLFGFIGLCQAAGDKLPFEQRRTGRWVVFLAGTAVVTFFGSLPWVGWFAMFLAGSVGIGAVLSTQWSTETA